jgi:hypothetical protein
MNSTEDPAASANCSRVNPALQFTKKPAFPCGDAGLVMRKTVGGTPTLLELFSYERGGGFLHFRFGDLLVAEPGAA